MRPRPDPYGAANYLMLWSCSRLRIAEELETIKRRLTDQRTLSNASEEQLLHSNANANENSSELRESSGSAMRSPGEPAHLSGRTSKAAAAAPASTDDAAAEPNPYEYSTVLG